MPKGQRTSLTSIEKQIASLQAKAEAIKSKDRQGVVDRINEAIRHYGIEIRDLVFGERKRGRPAKPAATGDAAKPVRRIGKASVKYRDGTNTWAGRGKRPRWLQEKLAEGAKLEDFLVK
jgi:DNA-binding protein H-NS